MRRVLKLIGFVSVTLILFVIVSALAFYHLMRVGEVRRFLVDEIEKRTQLRTQLGAAELEIGWITGIVFADLALTEPDASQPAVTAERVIARVALLPLLRRQIVFYEIRVQRPTAVFVRDRDGRFPLLDKLLNLPFLKQQESEFSLDLRALKIDEGDIALVDQGREESLGPWRLVNADLDLERLRGQRLRAFMKDLLKRQPAAPEAAALAFELKGAVLRGGAKINLKAQGQLGFPKETLEFHEARWAADVELVNVPAALVKDYLGARLPIQSMAGYLAQRIHIEGNPATSLRVTGALDFRRLSLDAPELFLAPLTGADGRTTFEIGWSRKGLQVRADFRANDIRFSLQGDVAAIDTDDPRLRLNLSALTAPAAALLKYLPLKIVGSRELENIAHSIQAGQVEVKKASVDATLSQLRRLKETGARQIWLEAELRDFAAKLNLDGAWPLRGVQGKIKIADGVLAFENFRGAYGDSRFSDVDGSYDLSPEEFGKLDLKARGEINLAELKEQLTPLLSPRTARLLASVQELSGRGKVDLGLQRLPQAPVRFGGKIALDQVRFRYDEFSLGDMHGELAFTPQEIKGEKITAQFAGSPIQIRLALKDYAGDDASFDLGIESSGVKAGLISRLLLDSGRPQDSGIVRGSVRYFGSLSEKSRRKFTGHLDLFNVQLAVDPLLQPLRELSGKIHIDETGIDFVNLRALLVGVPAAASGRWRYSGKPQLLFDFAAPSLDITYLISQIDPESSEFYANLVAEGKIALQKGRIKNFDFSDLKTHAAIDRRVWRLTHLSARSAGGAIQGVTTIFDRPETLLVRTQPRIQDVPIQSFLNWFGVTTTEMTGRVNLSGQLETVGKNDAERKQNLNGAFNLRIEDGTINRMRILVQILNLLDLSRWFTFQLPDLTKQGIRFRAITGDFKVTQGVYATENLVVDSSDLRMTGAGRIDVPKDEVDFVVAVRPFAGIDSAIHQIPIFGRGIAAIKNSFLVASFNIKGRIDDPAITPAPLGTLSEMFWSVLGIPKNVVGLGEEDKKEEAKEPAKPPVK
ncbi:MAG TPA: AsmA-like C-terminal domain-containing protein [Candidatus Binatia bacterium]